MNYNEKKLLDLYEKEQNKTATAKAYCKSNNIEYSDSIRRSVSKVLNRISDNQTTPQKVENKTTTSDNDYKPSEVFYLSALNKETGKILTIEEYCEKYNLNYKDVSSYKFLPHHYAEPSYNIVFKEKVLSEGFNIDNIKQILTKEIQKVYEYKNEGVNDGLKEGIIKWADLHFGALIKELLLTKDFNVDILRQGLLHSVEDFNMLKFKKRHVHIQGDLIESFSGLNHINSWQSMDSDMIGATAIKMCAKLLHEALSQIENLGCIKITAGNHDRLSKNNDEDVKGGAAELIAWGLELMGYDVEFHPYVITHKVDDINYINLHGDKKVSSKTSEEIVSMYGDHSCYNFITEAHLHQAIEKLTAKQRSNFKVIKDDKLKLRRITLKPFFTGNYYSETLGYVSNAGYSIIWSNERGLPKILDNTI